MMLLYLHKPAMPGISLCRCVQSVEQNKGLLSAEQHNGVLGASTRQITQKTKDQTPLQQHALSLVNEWSFGH